jgi:aryl-alcohol dehydrogenase-like predicted oxidoreductase
MRYGLVEGIHARISRLVQGTNFMTLANLDDSVRLLDSVLELGCTAVDTARSYQNGESQKVLGEWIESRGVRDQVVVISKGGLSHQGLKRMTPEDLTQDLVESLEDLKTDYIDLYLLHRDDPDKPVGPIVEVLNEHVRGGRIRAFGGSNWTHQRIQEANAYAEANGLAPFAASSPQFSLAVQHRSPYPDNPGAVTLTGSSQEAAREWYRRNQMPVFAWSSLAGGFLTGRFRRDNLNQFDDPNDRRVVSAYCSESNFALLDRATELAAQKGVVLSEIGIAYLLHHELNVFALVGCRGRSEFEALCPGTEWALSADEITWLESASSRRNS